MERAGTEDSIAEAEQEEEVIINYINFRYEIQKVVYVVMLRSHKKSPSAPSTVIIQSNAFQFACRSIPPNKRTPVPPLLQTLREVHPAQSNLAKPKVHGLSSTSV